jgi:hypothetical protein
MTAALLPAPELQFINGNGQPISSGTVETYIPGTSTPKTTWSNQAQTSVNTNPIVLNSEGRCIIFADGDYRIVLRDAVGNEVYDQLSSTIVSSAMAPVMLASTIADAVNLLGLGGGSVADEAAARAAADSAEQTARIAADNALGTRIDGEVTARTAADANLQTQINTITGGTAPASPLPTGYSMRFGNVTSDSGGNYSATFSPPFPSGVDSITTTCQRDSTWASVGSSSAGGFSGHTASPQFGGSWVGGPVGVFWMAIGH